MDNITPDFDTALVAFVTACQERINTYYATNFHSLTPPTTLTVERGSKNVRIVDGVVLKAAGWKAPAKHGRGSIYVNRGQDAVNEYGAVYLR